MSTPLQNFFSAPRHTMRSPRYHHAPRSTRIAIQSRVAHPCGRQLNRYRQLENDLEKVCGGAETRRAGLEKLPYMRGKRIRRRAAGRREHGSRWTEARPRTGGERSEHGRTHAGERSEHTRGQASQAHRDGGLKSPPLTRHQQTHTRARAGERSEQHGQRAAGSDRAGGTTATASRASSKDSERSEQHGTASRASTATRPHGQRAQRAARTASKNGERPEDVNSTAAQGIWVYCM